MKCRLVGILLILVLIHALPTAAADSGPTFEALQGTLGKGKKTSFTMLLRREGSVVSGVYFYDAIKIDIRLAGSWQADGTLALTESDGKGQPSATFSGKFVGTHLTGHWSQLKGIKGKPPRDFEFSAEWGLKAVDISAIGEKSYDGRLGSKHAIRMALSGQAGKLSGYYRYRASKEDLALSGELSSSGQFHLEEHDKRAKVTGTFSGLFLAGLRVFGTWSNPAGTKVFPVQLALSRTEMRPAMELPGGWRLLPKDIPMLDKTCDASGGYYEALGLANPAAAKKINGTLKKLAEGNSYCEDTDASNELQRSSSYCLNWPKRLGKFLLFEQTYYTDGGVHPTTSSSSLIIDTETGETVDLVRYLKPNQAAAFSHFVNKKALEEAEDRSLFCSEEVEITSMHIYPQGDSAVVEFFPDELAAYAVEVSTKLDKVQLCTYFQVNADTHDLFGL